MIPFRLSPYVHTVENRLIPGLVQRGIFHQLTGEVFEVNETIQSLLNSLKLMKLVWMSVEELKSRTDAPSLQVRQLILKEFLIPEGADPLYTFAKRYAVRPIQNPALAYCGAGGEVLLVRTSMAEHIFSLKRDEPPRIIEERMPPLAAEIFLRADGTQTLRQIFEELNVASASDLLKDAAFKDALHFLTTPERQLVKFTSQPEDVIDPFKPCNIVPRHLYHALKWEPPEANLAPSIANFHLHGIEDALWEFDMIEPTLNHAFRFPSEALGGLDYGSRFCLSALTPEACARVGQGPRLSVLEVGGGTGTFARSFIKQAVGLTATRLNGAEVSYQIMELSPALIASQKKVLAEQLLAVEHVQQDATEFDLPAHKFDLIIANEVVADFPVASVHRIKTVEMEGDDKHWSGEGVSDVERYALDVADAPDSFLVNTGVFRFIERAWNHLNPGGALIITEYGGENRYPSQAYQLNHEEFSIHFGHAAACARKVGFHCRLLSLKDFLEADDEVLMLDGREERILCLNSILQKFNLSLPFAAISKNEFHQRFREVIERIKLTGMSFSPLSAGSHYGPNWNEFMALIMNKPEDAKAS